MADRHAAEKPSLKCWSESLLRELRTGRKRNLAIAYAQEGFDYTLLAQRIEEGIASNEERALAANILRGRVKKPSHRPRSFEKKLLDLFICNWVARLTERYGEKEYIAFEIAAKDFDLSVSAVRKIYKKFLLESAKSVRNLSRSSPKSALR
jgi:hypothetical protein